MLGHLEEIAGNHRRLESVAELFAEVIRGPVGEPGKDTRAELVTEEPSQEPARSTRDREVNAPWPALGESHRLPAPPRGAGRRNPTLATEPVWV
jgi:hypothetical protein